MVPRAGESLPGFLMRLARRAGFSDTRRLAKLAGLLQPGCAITKIDLSAVEELFACGPIEHLRYAPSGRFAHHGFLNGDVHREMLDLSRRRFCPECLGHADHHRTAWDLVLVTACSEHRRRLIDRCPECGRRFGWFRPGVEMCTCGCDIRRAPPLIVPEAEADASRDIVAIAGMSDHAMLPVPLAGCHGGDLVRLAMRMGMFRTGWEGERRIETMVGRGPEAVATVMVAGLESLHQWPNPFETLIAMEADRAGMRSGRYGANKTLGRFYFWARDLETGPIKDAVIDVLRRRMASDPFSARRNHRSRLLAGPHSAESVVSLGEARAILGRSHAFVRRMLDSGELACSGDEGRGAPVAIGRREVEAIAAAAAGTMTLAAAARKLAVSKDRVRGLLGAGLISGCRAPGAPWMIAVDALEGLLSRLEATGCQTVAASPGMQFESAVRAMRKRGIGFAEAVEMAADGRVPVIGVDERQSGLKRLRLDVGQTSLADNGTIRAFAERLGVKWGVAAHLLARGLLERTPGGVERFRETYVSGSELGRARGTSPKVLVTAMSKARFAPVTGPSVDGGRQYFYRRAKTLDV